MCGRLFCYDCLVRFLLAAWLRRSCFSSSFRQDMQKLRKYRYGMGDYELPYPPPSEEELQRRPLDLPISTVKPVEAKKPPVPAALLFPGQGSQYVGMMKGAVDRPNVKASGHGSLASSPVLDVLARCGSGLDLSHPPCHCSVRAQSEPSHRRRQQTSGEGTRWSRKSNR